MCNLGCFSLHRGQRYILSTCPPEPSAAHKPSVPPMAEGESACFARAVPCFHRSQALAPPLPCLLLSSPRATWASRMAMVRVALATVTPDLGPACTGPNGTLTQASWVLRKGPQPFQRPRRRSRGLPWGLACRPHSAGVRALQRGGSQDPPEKLIPRRSWNLHLLSG